MRHRRLKLARRQCRTERSGASPGSGAYYRHGCLWSRSCQETNCPEHIQISENAWAKWLGKTAKCIAKSTAREVGRQKAGENIPRLADDSAQNLIEVEAIAGAYHSSSVIKQTW